jgi:hypothetical protein
MIPRLARAEVRGKLAIAAPEGAIAEFLDVISANGATSTPAWGNAPGYWIII